MKRLVLIFVLVLGGCASHWVSLDPHANLAATKRICNQQYSNPLVDQCMNMHGFFAEAGK
jgi:hypothetical protein